MTLQFVSGLLLLQISTESVVTTIKMPYRKPFLGSVSKNVVILIITMQGLDTVESLSNRRLMGSTDQADPSCIYFRIS